MELERLREEWAEWTEAEAYPEGDWHELLGQAEELAHTLIAALEAEVEALRVCGNCALSDWDGTLGGLWCAAEQVRRHEARGDSEMDVPPFDHCHYDQSRWTRREA